MPWLFSRLDRRRMHTASRKQELHASAVAKRRKAKRGGPR